MFCYIINVWGIWWIESKVKIIESEPMKSTKLIYVLIIKYIF